MLRIASQLLCLSFSLTLNVKRPYALVAIVRDLVYTLSISVQHLWGTHSNSDGSFTPKLNLQPTGFRLAPNWLQTGKMQLGCIGIAWLHSHQF